MNVTRNSRLSLNLYLTRLVISMHISKKSMKDKKTTNVKLVTKNSVGSLISKNILNMFMKVKNISKPIVVKFVINLSYINQLSRLIL